MSFTNDTTIAGSDLSIEGSDVTVAKCTLTLSGSHQLASLTILNDGVVTHAACSSTALESLDLRISKALVIDATSRIDVSGRGYLPGRTAGNSTTGAAGGRSGGSYGGLGQNDAASNLNWVYGDFRQPTEPGSGGGTDLGSASGGGLIHIVASTIQLEGQILANGTGGTDYWNRSAGSGGGIWLEVQTLSGAGAVAADGGSGGAYDGGSGGGGRVAVYYTTATGFNLVNVTARGGTGGRGPGAVGTVYLSARNGESVLRISGQGANTGMFTPLGLKSQEVIDLSAESLLISGTNVVVRPEHPMLLQAKNITVTDYAVLTQIPTGADGERALAITVLNKLQIDATAKLDVSGLGYAAGKTAPTVLSGGATFRAGGSYGGLGSVNGTPNAVYGDFHTPGEPGSGGGADLGSASGGGVIRINASNVVANGVIAADGASGFDYWNRAAASGGAIWITADNLSGSGVIRANGGNGSQDGGSGGGGRIAVYFKANTGFDLNRITAHGGNGDNGLGAVGTVYLKPGSGQATLRLDNHGGLSGSWTPLGVATNQVFDIGSDKLVISGTNVVAKPEHQMSVLAHDFTVQNQAILTHQPTTGQQPYSLLLTVAGTLTVDAQSSIDVSALGYLVGTTLGNTNAGGATYRAGGSYGGLGGMNGTPNVVYGDYHNPNEPGAGGGPDLGHASGGGLIRINAGVLALDGLILANGGNGSGYWDRAGGSGGGIWISADSIAGVGAIRANGGNASEDGGAGGGGRVALYYAANHGFNFDSMTAHGGSGGFGPGAVGSVYLKDTGGEGVLRFDNHGTASGAWVPLGLNSSTLFDSGDDRVVISGDRMVIKPDHPMTVRMRSLSLERGAVLTHIPTTAQQESWLELIITEALTVDAASQIDVSGLGYGPGKSIGNTTQAGAIYRAGGSYGGLGNPNGIPPLAYGDYRNPHELGSGGGPDLGNASGGGRIRITVPRLVLDGVISANGVSGYDYWNRAGASGGAVWINVGTLSGVGTIRANGGNASDDGGGGGGGRVAVYCADHLDFSVDRILAHGGQGGSGPGAVGTVYVKVGANRGQLYLDNHGAPAGSWTPLGSAHDTVFDASEDVIVIKGTNVVVKPAQQIPLKAYALSLLQGALLTHRPVTATELFWLDLQVQDRLQVDASSSIDVTARGFLAGRTSGNNTDGGATGRAGGSYGGSGGAGSFGYVNATYGKDRNPDEPGAGSGTDLGHATGGGLARLSAATLLLDGAIRADGGSGFDYWNRAGASGGGLLINTGQLRGLGTISANGGNASDDGGAGGGGRVVVYIWETNSFPSANITAAGGGSGQNAGQAGSVLLATSPLFFWEGADEAMAHGDWPLAWAGYGVNPAGVSVDVVAFRNGAAYPVLSGQPMQGAAIWDTADVPDGLYEVRAIFRDTSQKDLGEATCSVTVINQAQWHSGTITGSESWSAGTVQIVEGNLIISEGATVTLAPGAIVKFAPKAEITVNKGGLLQAHGTSNSEIAFTSVTDDSVGGDSNYDGAKSHPFAGEWNGITVQPDGNFDYNDQVLFRYLRVSHSGTLTQNETWLGTFLHRVTGDIAVPNGTVLTIQPGAIVKFDPGLGLTVQSGAQIVAQGTVALPITFTSARDDSVGGDTNADGDKTHPDAGDWHWVLLDGGVGSFDHCLWRYGGGPAEGGWGPSGGPGKATLKTQGNATLTLANSKMENSFYDGILNWGGTSTIVNTVVTGSDRAICAHPSSVVSVVNCTVDDNRIGLLIHGGELRATNTVVANSYTAGVFHDYGPDALTLRSSDVWNPSAVSGNYYGTADQTGLNGNSSADPKFKDVSLANYRLNYGSPCIDAADGRAAPATDLMGAPRYDDPRTANLGRSTTSGAFADLGAYEFVETADSDLDLAVDWVDGPTSATAGAFVKIRWQITNRGSGRVQGGWHDAISLKADFPTRSVDRLDVKEVQVPGLLGPGASSIQEAEVRVPGGTEGTWRWQVAANVRGEVFEGRNTGNNTSPLSVPVELSVPELPLGTVVHGEFSGINQPSCYIVHQLPGVDLLVTLDAQAAGSRNRVYVGFESMPTEISFDQRSTEWNAPDARIGIAAPPAARAVYLMIIPESNPGGGTGYDLQASRAVFSLTGLGISAAGNSGTATVPLIGSGFSAAMLVELRSSLGSTTIRAQQVRYRDSAHVLATFDLTSAPLGLYHVAALQQGLASSLANAFTVRRGLGGQLDVQLVLPERARIGRPFKAYAKFVNSGGADLPPTLLTLRNSAGNPMWLEKTNQASVVQVVALSGSDLKLDFLPPGDRGSILFNSLLLTGNADYSVDWENALSTAPMDWAVAKARLKPADASPSWDSQWDAFVQSIGNTEGAYIAAAAAAAAEASQSGLEILNNAELMQYLLERQTLDRAPTSIRGRALSSDNQQPIGDGRLLLQNVVTRELQIASTWPDGQFVFTDVPDGQYELTMENYASEHVITLQIPADGQVAVPDYAFARQAELIGRIVNAVTQTPIAGARVTVTEPVSKRIVTTLSDEAGQYQLAGLIPGLALVDVEADGFVAAPSVEVALDTAAPQPVSVALDPGGSIRGRVLGLSGAPAAQALVQVMAQEQIVQSTIADELGQFCISGLTSGAYSVWAAQTGSGAGMAANVPVAAGQTAAATITLQSHGNVTGTVTERATGNPIANATVLIEAFTSSQFYTTDALGRYQIDDVAPGQYEILAAVPDFMPGSGQVQVTAGVETKANFGLRRAGLVSGTIKINGAAAQNMTLRLSATNVLTLTATSAADGTFRFADLPDGHFVLSALLGSSQTLAQQQVNLDATKNRYQASFDLKLGSVQGRVVNSSGQPIASVPVALLRGGQVVQSTVTDSTGTYAALVPTAGDYQLTATGVPIGFIWRDGVQLAAGQTLTIPDLVPSGTALKVVTSAVSLGSNVLAFAMVSVAPSAAMAPPAPLTDFTDATGQVVFNYLVPGDYEVTVSGPTVATSIRTVTIGSAPSTIKMDLVPPTVIQGRVVDATARPVSGALVLLTESGTQRNRSRLTDDTGHFIFDGLASVAYDLWALDGVRCPQFVPGLTPLGRITPSIDVVLQSTGALLSGTVVNAQNLPVNGVSIYLLSAGGQLLQTTASDSQGAYALVPLARGSYTLQFAWGEGVDVEMPLSVITSQILAPVVLNGRIIETRATAEDAPVAQLLSLGVPQVNSEEDIPWWHDLGFAAGDAIPFPQNAGWDTPRWRAQWQADRTRYVGSGKNCDGLDELLLKCQLSQQTVIDSQQNTRQAYLALRQLDTGASLQTVNKAVVLTGKIVQLLAKMNDMVPEAGSLAGLVNTATIDKGQDAAQAAQIAVAAYKDIEILFKLAVDTAGNVAEATLKGDLKRSNFAKKEFKATMKALASAMDKVADPAFGGLVGFIGKEKKGFSKGLGLLTTLYDLFEYVEQLEKLQREVGLGLRVYSTANFMYMDSLRRHALNMAALKAAVNGCLQTQTLLPPSDTNNPNNGQDSGVGQGGSVAGVGSHDPNDKLTVGYGQQGFVAADTWLFYTIRFENQTNATAAAQTVTVNDPLDPKLDWSSFELMNIGFNLVDIQVPSGQSQYRETTSVPTDPENDVMVQASFDPNSGLAQWTLQSIDPVTQAPPEDPLAGFLPPNDAQHRGEGYVSYRIRPRGNSTSGTVITNGARIAFDENAAINTPMATNTLDFAAPASAVLPLPASSPRTFEVRWGGVDSAAGSGLKAFDIYVSRDGASYSPWLSATTNTSASFSGEISASYAFFSIATDNVGNREAPPDAADTSTRITNNSEPGSTSLVWSSTGATVTIAWPRDATNYQLESTASVADPESWSLVQISVVVVGDQNTVTFGFTGKQRFFRLRQP